MFLSFMSASSVFCVIAAIAKQSQFHPGGSGHPVVLFQPSCLQIQLARTKVVPTMRNRLRSLSPKRAFPCINRSACHVRDVSYPSDSWGKLSRGKHGFSILGKTTRPVLSRPINFFLKAHQIVLSCRFGNFLSIFHVCAGNNIRLGESLYKLKFSQSKEMFCFY